MVVNTIFFFLFCSSEGSLHRRIKIVWNIKSTLPEQFNSNSYDAHPARISALFYVLRIHTKSRLSYLLVFRNFFYLVIQDAL